MTAHRTRREVLSAAGVGLAAGALSAVPAGLSAQPAAPPPAGSLDVRAFGALGDGRAIDTPAVNRAIQRAADGGGGTVRFPAGTYACYSIHLKSRVTLYLEPGAVIVAAATPLGGMSRGGFDAAESNYPWEAYQDFGHNHWHNSLIWGEDLNDIAILGPGLIWGRGLSRGHADPDLPRAEAQGVGNKAIALKRCRNVLLRDFAILAGGHFAILATGVDDLTIDNLRIDTNRDGMDIDCCRNVRITNCSVNSPWDDGICPKSSFALGEPRITENVTIANCYVTGDFRLGTLLDGTRQRLGPDVAGGPVRIGRIKCGTESNGGFRNITITNCQFESCWGLALETVDGGIIEDISVTGLTMRDIRDAPLFLRLGARLRSPAKVPVGRLRRVVISDVTCSGPANDTPSIISGVPGHLIEDVQIRDVRLSQAGGGTRATAALHPAELETEYPEPYWFGPLPAQHFFIRHVRNLTLTNVEMETLKSDARPVLWLHDVNGAAFSGLRLPKQRSAPALLLEEVRDLSVRSSRGAADIEVAYADQQVI